MYWAPRGSWCAHISSRTAVCSQTEAPRPPQRSGQAMHSRPRSASMRQNRCAVSRSAGSSVKAPRKSGGTCSLTSWRSPVRSATTPSPMSKSMSLLAGGPAAIDTIVWPVTYRPASLTSHNTAPTKSSTLPSIGSSVLRFSQRWLRSSS